MITKFALCSLKWWLSEVREIPTTSESHACVHIFIHQDRGDGLFRCWPTPGNMSQSEPLLSGSAELGGHTPREVGDSRVRRLAICAVRKTAKHLINGNALLAFVPLGLVAGSLQWNAVMVSIFNFLAIIPLSAFVSGASDTLAIRWGSLIGGLFNATFGNTVELIVSCC